MDGTIAHRFLPFPVPQSELNWGLNLIHSVGLLVHRIRGVQNGRPSNATVWISLHLALGMTNCAILFGQLRRSVGFRATFVDDAQIHLDLRTQFGALMLR